MQNAIQRILASPPGHLRVVRSGDGVFKVRVSNQNIANILGVIGAIRLGSSLVAKNFTKFFKIPRHIESLDTCIKH